MPFLGSVYQIFGLYPEIYHAMISMEIKEQQFVDEAVEQEEQETEG
ncbi:phosphonate ABC transporter permease [Bacillus sp. C1]